MTHPCILCGAADLDLFLDLGRSALANKFLTQAELAQKEPIYPLRTGWCPACGHVQLMDLVPPAEMFEDYLYISSVSETLKNHLYSLSDVVTTWRGLTPSDLVIDIGCNDGTLLAGFKRHGVRVQGVDPAQNLAPLAKEKGVPVKTAFFGRAVAEDILRDQGPARAITMTNAFPHIPQLDDLMGGVSTLLADDGVFVIEAHYLLDMLEQVAFDTIYHEHVSYWALGPMINLFTRHGLEVVDVARLAIHHGQLRVFVQRRGAREPSAAVAERLAEETAQGLPGRAPLTEFAERSLAIRAELHRFIADARSQGKHIAAYGAPAKGNTLLSFLELGPQEIVWIADRSPLKQNRFTPGTHIPVVDPARILEEMPDYLLLLAWNFADEIFAQQAVYRERGGKFVIPVPSLQIL